MLAETGVKSERLKPQVNRSETWSAVDDDTLKADEEGDVSDAESDASDASDASSALGLAGDRRDEEDSSDDEAAAFAAREKAMLRGKGRPETPKGKGAGGKAGKFEKRKSFDAQRPGAIGKSPRGKPGRGERPSPYSRDRPPHMKGKRPQKEKPVRALSPPVLPEAKEGSMRAIKKEGFSKFHRSANGKKQPNMAARMDVLLEKIRRSK